MPKQVELTKKKQDQVDSRREATLKGNGLPINVSGKIKYQKQIDKLIERMVKETIAELEKLFKSPTADKFFDTQDAADFLPVDAELSEVVDRFEGFCDTEDASISSQARITMDKLTKKFEQLFDNKSESITESMLRNENKASQINTAKSFKKLTGGASIDTKFMTASMKEIVKASAAESTALIRFIPQKHMEAVQGAVMRSITTGNGLQDLVPFLENRTGITKRRARFIAKDQTKKAYNNMNAKRMEAVGLDEYEWVHGHPKEPRALHAKSHKSGGLNGGIYSLAKPPIIVTKTGQRGKPGDLPGCTCFMKPVIRLKNGKKANG